MPGDIKTASSYWSGASNGDGNGYINNGTDYTADANSGEAFTFFQHLSRAGVIPYNYTNGSTTLGVGYPRLKISPSQGMTAASAIDISNSCAREMLSSCTARSRAALFLDVSTPFSGSWNDNIGVMTPSQEFALDTKIDDGKATKGLFRGYNAFSNSTHTCLTATDGDYNITNNSIMCMGEYILK